MTESAGLRRASNPLHDDLVLFDMFMEALDGVVANSEIKAALEEFRFPPQRLRGIMIAGAGQILKAAPREFEAYEKVRERVGGFSTSGAEAESPGGKDPLHMVRLASLGSIVGGLLFVIGGLASFPLWPWTEPLVWAGITMIAVAGFLYSAPRLATGLGLRLLTGQGGLNTNVELDEARNRLMSAVGQEEFLAQARTLINTARQDQFSHAYSVTNISGLSEIYDTTYQVPTDIAAELSSLLERLDGASIGIAGPRGSGKSTLIRGYCEDGEPAQDDGAQDDGGEIWDLLFSDIDDPSSPRGDLRCMVSAPVDYAARDFVLHLFAVFCRSVIRRYDPGSIAPSSTPAATMALRIIKSIPTLFSALISWVIRYWIPAGILIHWQQPIAGALRIRQAWVFYAGIAVAVLGTVRLAWAPARIARRAHRRASSEADGHALAAKAKEYLNKVRYLQTAASGWSGTLSLARTSGQYSRSHTQSEQPLSYPEIVDEFRRFAREVGADVHRHGERVFIGIDELDKIGTPEQAERFLNEIKGIFGIPHMYFMVSVSDDALTAFERRGLPLRDAFDSSFDEIIHVGPLSYAESRRLLYRRVIGLTEPYVALCHCLAGGLARELIRAARQVTRAGVAVTSDDRTPSANEDELNLNSFTAFLLRPEPVPKTLDLSTVCAEVVRDELFRKTRAAAHVASSIAPEQAPALQGVFHDIVRRLIPGMHAMEIVDIARRPIDGQSDAMAALQLDFAAYAYYCATLQDIFTDLLDPSQMINATSVSPAPGTFDALAAVRQAFTVDTHLAWQSITQFRQVWSLETREPPIYRRKRSRFHKRPWSWSQST